MRYVIGVDLGTSAVKVLLVDETGTVCAEATESYPLLQPQSGYSEQDPEHWVKGTLTAIHRLVENSGVLADAVQGISFSGQMHGLVLLDDEFQVLRNAILWNDTRTTAQCREIEAALGDELLAIAKNRALEGFTLPKLLWVKQHEPELYKQAAVFLLPKDYLRFRLTGELALDLSDAAGTLLLDVASQRWSERICAAVGIDPALCPPLVAPTAESGALLPAVAQQAGLSPRTRVFAGGADNACGAIGAGILSAGEALVSIGTSGVVLAYEPDGKADYRGQLHLFNHGKPDAFYAMGVTLAAGYSLQWFKEAVAPHSSFDELLASVADVAAGSGGLLFTPYIVGERTPHADASIRGSFIGLDASHRLPDMTRAVLEGITFSLRESVDILRQAGKRIDRLISIGGGAKNETWLQMQADIFGAEIVKLGSEQGPGMGAAMLAAVGCGWFEHLEACADTFLQKSATFTPNKETVHTYEALYQVYRRVYEQTRELNEALVTFRTGQS